LIDSNYRRTQHEKQLATQPLLAPGYRNTETSWFDRAACKDAPDPEVFFPVSDEAKKTEPWHEFCDDCPVRKECGAFAQRRGLIGVWGGTYRPGNLLSARLRGRPRHKNKPLGSEAASVAPVAGKGAL
jgi:WhiB family redox-sensing transcriptional regulator